MIEFLPSITKTVEPKNLLLWETADSPEAVDGGILCPQPWLSQEVGLVWLSYEVGLSELYLHKRKLRLRASVTARREEPVWEPLKTGRKPGFSSLTGLSPGNPDSETLGPQAPPPRQTEYCSLT